MRDANGHTVPVDVAMIGFAAFDVPAILGLTRRIFTFSTYVFWVLTPSEGAPEYGNVASLSVIMVALAAILSVAYRRAQQQAPKGLECATACRLGRSSSKPWASRCSQAGISRSRMI